MKFDKYLYEGLVRRPLMMVKKSDENSRALALNEKVGENCFLARTTCLSVNVIQNMLSYFIKRIL